MIMLASITRPWILYVQQMGATPRTLADDLMLTMTSPVHTQGYDDGMMDTLCIAVEATFEFIHDMGGKPSPNKSAVMASCSENRKRLRAHKWGPHASVIQVRHNLRDLGSHLTISGTPTGTTLNKRAASAAAIMDRIKALPAPADTKSRLIVGKGYAMGLYGVEATPLNVSALRRLQRRTADALAGRHQTMRCLEVVLAVAGSARIEIEAVILWRRVRMLRRAWRQRPPSRSPPACWRAPPRPNGSRGRFCTESAPA
jgi:hypothetical protein